jgi:hypothetical protein
MVRRRAALTVEYGYRRSTAIRGYYSIMSCAMCDGCNDVDPLGDVLLSFWRSTPGHITCGLDPTIMLRVHSQLLTTSTI